MNNKMFIGGIAVIVAGILFAGLHNCGTISIKKQGVFAAGGENIVHSGKYDNKYFAGWGEQKEDGQSYHHFQDERLRRASNEVGKHHSVFQAMHDDEPSMLHDKVPCVHQGVSKTSPYRLLRRYRSGED